MQNRTCCTNRTSLNIVLDIDTSCQSSRPPTTIPAVTTVNLQFKCICRAWDKLDGGSGIGHGGVLGIRHGLVVGMMLLLAGDFDFCFLLEKIWERRAESRIECERFFANPSPPFLQLAIFIPYSVSPLNQVLPEKKRENVFGGKRNWILRERI